MANYIFSQQIAFVQIMSLKRIHPSFNLYEQLEDPFEKTLDDDLSEYECFRKRVKKDLSTSDYKNLQEDHVENELVLQNNLHFQANNLYGQEFQNLKACSFKTISRIGHDKNYSFIKNQVAQSDDRFSLSNRKKRPSLANLSQEKSKHKKKLRKNIVRNHRKTLASFGSLNEISKLEKRISIDSQKITGMRNCLKKIQSSVSGLGSGSMNQINTQMMNEMMDFNIKDDNEVDEIYLYKMMETALIKNVSFSANLCIVLIQRNNEVLYSQSPIIYKLLDVDGFSIKGLYAVGEKIRINLKKPITNKQFQRKFVFQPQTHPNIQASKSQMTRDNGIEFQGSLYDLTTHKSELVKFYLSGIKDKINSPNWVDSDEIENINFENWMMPKENSFESSFGFGTFNPSKSQN